MGSNSNKHWCYGSLDAFTNKLLHWNWTVRHTWWEKGFIAIQIACVNPSHLLWSVDGYYPKTFKANHERYARISSTHEWTAECDPHSGWMVNTNQGFNPCCCVFHPLNYKAHGQQLAKPQLQLLHSHTVGIFHTGIWIFVVKLNGEGRNFNDNQIEILHHNSLRHATTTSGSGETLAPPDTGKTSKTPQDLFWTIQPNSQVVIIILVWNKEDI